MLRYLFSNECVVVLGYYMKWGQPMKLDQTFIKTPLGLINPKFNQLLINGRVTLSLRGAPNGVFTHDVEGNFSQVVLFKEASQIDEIGIVNLFPKDGDAYTVRANLANFTIAGGKTVAELLTKVTLKDLTDNIFIKLSADYFLIKPEFFGSKSFLNSSQSLPAYYPLAVNKTLFTDTHNQHYVVPLPTSVQRIAVNDNESIPIIFFEATGTTTPTILLKLDDDAKAYRYERPSSDLTMTYQFQIKHQGSLIVHTLNGFEVLSPEFFSQGAFTAALAEPWIHAIESDDKAEW